jgi:hypothetical protein
VAFLISALSFCVSGSALYLPIGPDIIPGIDPPIEPGIIPGIDPPPPPIMSGSVPGEAGGAIGALIGPPTAGDGRAASNGDIEPAGGAAELAGDPAGAALRNGSRALAAGAVESMALVEGAALSTAMALASPAGRTVSADFWASAIPSLTINAASTNRRPIVMTRFIEHLLVKWMGLLSSPTWSGLSETGGSRLGETLTT